MQEVRTFKLGMPWKTFYLIYITHLTESRCETWVNTNMGTIIHFPFPQTHKSTTVLNHVGQTKIFPFTCFYEQEIQSNLFVITVLLWWEENFCYVFIFHSVSPVRGDCLHLAKCFHFCANFKTIDLCFTVIIDAEMMTTFCVFLIYPSFLQKDSLLGQQVRQ